MSAASPLSHKPLNSTDAQAPGCAKPSDAGFRTEALHLGLSKPAGFRCMVSAPAPLKEPISLLNSPITPVDAQDSAVRNAPEAVYAARERGLDLEGVDPIKLAKMRMLCKLDSKFVRPQLSESELATMKANFQGRQLKRIGHGPVAFGFRESQQDFFQQMLESTRRAKAQQGTSAPSCNKSDANRILAARWAVERKHLEAQRATDEHASFDSHDELASHIRKHSDRNAKLAGDSLDLPVQVSGRAGGVRSKLGKVGVHCRRVLSSGRAARRLPRRGDAREPEHAPMAGFGLGSSPRGVHHNDLLVQLRTASQLGVAKWGTRSLDA